jgi:hypothetical protein
LLLLLAALLLRGLLCLPELCLGVTPPWYGLTERLYGVIQRALTEGLI